MDVWLILGDCSDYYCEALHPLAVASTEEEAIRLKLEAEEATETYGAGDNVTSHRPWYMGVRVYKLPLDTYLGRI